MKRAVVSLFLCFFFHCSFSQSWVPVGGGVNDIVIGLHTFKGELYVGGGLITQAGTMPVNYIARWNGMNWDSVGAGIKMGSNGGVIPNAVYDSTIYVSGQFYGAGNDSAKSIAQWNGTKWDTVGSGIIAKKGNNVEPIVLYDKKIYAGGNFTKAQGAVIDANNIACWNGVKWDSVGSGADNEVWCMAVYNGELYAGGIFTHAGGITANHLASWDGSKWDSLGSGTDNVVLSLAVYKGELYTGGIFMHAGNLPVNNIARWDGKKWDSVGSGVSGRFTSIRAMTVFNGYLYVGGYFTTAGGIHASEIARWDGTKWDSVGIGLTGGLQGIRALAVYDSTLYAGGDFSNSGNTALNYIAMFCDTCPPLAVAELKAKSAQLQVFPNPSKGVFTFESSVESRQSKVEVYNMMGEEVKSEELRGKNTEIDLSGQPAGIYMYRVITETGKLAGEGKLVIE